MFRLNKTCRVSPLLMVAAALFLAGCEVGSATKGKSPYRAPSSGTSGVAPSASTAEVATAFSVTITVKDKSGFGIPNVVPVVTASQAGTGSTGVTSGGCGSTDRKGITSCTLTANLPGDYTVSVVSPVQITAAGTVTVEALPRSLSFSATMSTTAGSSTALATQPIVSVLDKAGNVITTSTDNVTLSLTSTTSTSGGTATLAGVLTVAAVAGVADFAGSGVAVDLVGGYTLTGTLTHATTGTITATSSTITISAGTATKLGFTTSPSTPTASNVAFTTQPIVAVQDAAGNTVTSGAACIITMSLQNGAATDNLFGTIAKTAVSGVSDFAGLGLRVDTTTGGSTYYLTASASGACAPLTSADSSTFTVNLSGLPSTLSVTQAPSASPLNKAWPTQPIVKVLDPDGILVSGDNTTVVTLAKTAGPAGGTIVGSTSLTVVNGVATFSGLKTTGVAGDSGTYTLGFTGTNPGLTITGASVNQSINENGLTPAKLAFSVQPQNVAIRQPMQSIVVETQDANSYFCFNDTASSVTLNFVSGPAGSSMYELGAPVGGAGSSTGAKTVVNGQASFPGISFDVAGTYVIRADSVGLTSVTSSTFAISSYTAADNLSFSTQPADAVGASPAEPWTTPPVVRVRDVYGNLVTGDNDTVVTLDCVSPLGCSLLGTTSVKVVNGVADYTGTNVRADVTVSTSNIVIRATSSPSLNSTTSTAFTQQ